MRNHQYRWFGRGKERLAFEKWWEMKSLNKAWNILHFDLDLFFNTFSDLNGFIAKRASRAPLLTNLVTSRSEKFCLWRQRTSARQPVQTLGEGEQESQDDPTGGGECHFFLAGNCAALLGNRRFSWREITRQPSVLKKRFFKSLPCLANQLSWTEVKFRTWEKNQITINGMKKFNSVLSCPIRKAKSLSSAVRTHFSKKNTRVYRN